MLTTSKPLSAGRAQSCHQTEFTAGEQNYWSQHGVTAPTRFASSSNGLVPIIMTACFGDIRQHQGVEARPPFDQLQEAGMRTAKLDEIVRRKDPALKSEVELLATGQVSAALDALRQQGRVKEIPNAEDRVRTIARGYVESPENTLIVSPDNASRRELNIAVRQELKANGTIASEDHKFSVLVQRQDMTGADRSWASRGLPRSLLQRKLLMTTHLFDNECDGSDLGVLCAVQHELVATIIVHNGISELEIAALASSRQPQTGCPVTARAALHNTSPLRGNEVF
jgi:AAA domain